MKQSKKIAILLALSAVLSTIVTVTFFCHFIAEINQVAIMGIKSNPDTIMADMTDTIIFAGATVAFGLGTVIFSSLNK